MYVNYFMFSSITQTSNIFRHLLYVRPQTIDFIVFARIQSLHGIYSVTEVKKCRRTSTLKRSIKVTLSKLHIVYSY